jgi:hypothetical protein
MSGRAWKTPRLRTDSVSAVSDPQLTPDRKKICLVLHATVDVRGVVFVKRDDPRERFEDYRRALKQWVQRDDFDKLVFVENSGYDVSPLQEIVDQSPLGNDMVEFLSFDGQDFPRELGKGYGETLNFQHVLDNSKILAEDDMLVRNNGRYYIENMHAFFEALQPPTEILVEMRQFLSYADVTVLGGTVDFFRKYICPYGWDVNDSKGYYMEHAYARATHRALADGLVWRPFPEVPSVVGFSGTENVWKKDNVVARTARSLRHKLRVRVYEA